MKKLGAGLIIALLSLIALGCENSNIYSWSHSKGSSDSTEVLMADASSALKDGDYKEAIEYYTDVLAKDPDNSEALYGIAAAELKDAGVDIASLLPKLLEQGEATDTDDLLGTLNANDIESGTSEAIDALQQIADGLGDGDIPADDFDVNLNLGIALTLHAASSLINWADASGAVEITDGYDVNVSSTGVNSAELKAELQSAKDEIEEAVHYLEVAASTSGTDVSDITSGFNELIRDLNAEIALL